MNVIEKLIEERNKVIEVQKVINDLAVKNERDLTTEEQETWDKADEDFESLSTQIDEAKNAEERQAERAKRLEERQEMLSKSMYKPNKPAVSSDPDDDTDSNNDNRNNDPDSKYVELPTEEKQTSRMEMFRCAIQNYRDVTEGRYSTPGYAETFNRALLGDCTEDEKRALQADKDQAGGFLVAPEKFVAQLIQSMDNLVFMRQKATTFLVPKAAGLGFPALQNDVSDLIWTQEIKTGDEDTTMDFDKRELFPHPFAKRIKVSKKLLRMSQLNVDALVRERLTYKVATVEENAFMNGDGTNKPLGLFVASSTGISTSRDKNTHNTTSALKADNLIECKYTLLTQYQARSEWILHRDILKMVRKLKTGDGDYIWRTGIATDRPDTILDRPYNLSEYAPNTISSGNYAAIIGDFTFYYIATALDMQIQVLTELYAETNQAGYIIRAETDGMPVLEEAFVRSTFG